MIRALNLLVVVPSITAAGVAAAASAPAQPPPPNPGPCTFTLSAPQVVQVDGVSKVTATITPTGCIPPWQPRQSVACIHVDGQGQCMQSVEGAVAQVYFEPYTPGATYVATGRGCGGIYPYEPDPNCALLGPVSATL